jgi:hypothetical protein
MPIATTFYPCSTLEGEPNHYLNDLVGGSHRATYANLGIGATSSPHQIARAIWLPLKGGAGHMLHLFASYPRAFTLASLSAIHPSLVTRHPL